MYCSAVSTNFGRCFLSSFTVPNTLRERAPEKSSCSNRSSAMNVPVRPTPELEKKLILISLALVFSRFWVLFIGRGNENKRMRVCNLQWTRIGVRDLLEWCVRTVRMNCSRRYLFIVPSSFKGHPLSGQPVKCSWITVRVKWVCVYWVKIIKNEQFHREILSLEIINIRNERNRL